MEKIDRNFRKNGATAYEELTLQQCAIVNSGAVLRHYMHKFSETLPEKVFGQAPRASSGSEGSGSCELPKKKARRMDDE